MQKKLELNHKVN